MDDPKATLLRYLRLARESLVWKLDGLSDYDVRRPLTPTGTNLLGLVKHVASVEAEYLGDCFGRPTPEHLPWFADDAPPNEDMWARPEESRQHLVDLYHRVWAHSDATVDALPLDAGLRAEALLLPEGDATWWQAYCDRVERAARAAPQG